MALAFGLHSLGASGSPTFSGAVAATEFRTTRSGSTGVILGSTALAGATLGIGLDTGAGDIQFYTSAVIWWRVNGATGGWNSPAGGGVVTTGVGSFGSITLSSGTNTYTAFSDGSGTPGNATNNNARGVNAIAGAASSCVVTNNKVTATSLITGVLQTNDATATSIKSIIPAAGSFTITVNAAATGTTKFGWVVDN